MAAQALGLPPSQLATDRLGVTYLGAEKLIRISRFNSGEPYFGMTGGNRFDAPGCLTGMPEFSSCYLGMSLRVAIAESILHDEIPVDGFFGIAQDTLESRYVLRFVGMKNKLRLLTLTGPTLKRYAGTAELAGTCDYAISQQWSLAVFQNPSNFDGFIYMSRHLNTGKAVVLFDRANTKIALASSTLLSATPGFASAARNLGIIGV